MAKVGLLILKGIRISKYFKNEDALKLKSLNIEDIVQEVEEFLVKSLPMLIQAA